MDKIFAKMEKREKTTLAIIDKKIEEIRTNPRHEYKFLRYPLEDLNRVHITGSFVLVFELHHDNEEVEIWDYDHHDNIYKSKRLLERGK